MRKLGQPKQYLSGTWIVRRKFQQICLHLANLCVNFQDSERLDLDSVREFRQIPIDIFQSKLSDLVFCLVLICDWGSMRGAWHGQNLSPVFRPNKMGEHKILIGKCQLEKRFVFNRTNYLTVIKFHQFYSYFRWYRVKVSLRRTCQHTQPGTMFLNCVLSKVHSVYQSSRQTSNN